MIYLYIYIKRYTIMKKEKAILIRLGEDLHTDYKKLCKEHGLNMSQSFRNFIKREIKRLSND